MKKDASGPAARAPQTNAPGDGQPQPLTINPLQLTLSVQTQMSEHRGLIASATACCTSLAIRLRAARVSIGMLKSNHCEVIASSQGMARSVPTPAREKIASAMFESISQQVLLGSVNANGSRHINVAQRDLAQKGTVITVPLASAGEPIGALTLEFDPEASPWLHPQIAAVNTLIETLVPVVSRILVLEQASEQNPVRFAWNRLATRKKYTGTNRRQLVLVAILAALAGLFFPFKQSINSDSRVEGAVQREVIASTEGYLKQVEVKPGDRVSKGQLLAILGERDLELNRDRLLGEIERHRAQATTAIADGNRSDMALANARVKQASAELSLIDEQLERTRVVSPIDGVVIEGDLWQSTGSPVDRGETLFTVAPVDDWRLVIDLEETRINKIEVGQTGQVYLTALPWQPIEFRTTRVAPMASVVNEDNVFEVHATLLNAPPDLRPGMRGTARLAAYDASLISRWTERAQRSVSRLWWQFKPWH